MKRLLLITMIVLLSSSMVPAQDFCKGDFNYNGSVAAEDVTIFLEHFGRNPFNNPCPPDGPAPVARTGQTACYDENGVERACMVCLPGEGCTHTGEDGYWQQGVQEPGQRFTDNGDDTVTDTLTGLIWYQNATLFGERSWTEALHAIDELNTGAAYGDWRLPNVRELQTLLDYSQRDPALPSEHPFLNIPLAPCFFWSATTKMGVEPSPFTEAYGVDLGDGTVRGYAKTAYTFYVWPVRGGHER